MTGDGCEHRRRRTGCDVKWTPGGRPEAPPLDRATGASTTSVRRRQTPMNEAECAKAYRHAACMSYLQLGERYQRQAREQGGVRRGELVAVEQDALVLDGDAGDGLEAGLELGHGPFRRDAALRGGVGGDDAQGDGHLGRGWGVG